MKTMRRTGKKGNGKFGSIQGNTFGRTEELETPKGSAGHAAGSDTSHQHVDGQSLASIRGRCRQPNIGGQPETEEDGEVGGVLIIGKVEEKEEE